MSLATGTRLGPYEILGFIGAGGMGEVYKARDTRLDRTVALKVLPRELGGDPDRRARFECEARAISALNHPHICALHDVGREGGIDFLVLEHLEGQTLAERLAKGPLPVSQAIGYAIQIADALDKAHRQGVVHRDLKPGNVMITKAGAKLLDFGLAKLRTAGPADPTGLSSLLTRTSPMTAQGTILGTLAYMSPEQVQGRDADARGDLFAFGAVLYEMLTGQPAFPGSNAASVIAAILDREPAPMASLQPAAPPALSQIVQACLAKDPDDRVQSAHDLVLDLRRLSGSASQPVVAIPGRRSRWHRVRVPLLAFLAGAALMAGVAAWWPVSGPAMPRRTIRFTIEVPASRELGALALSPDGTHLAYVGNEEGRALVFVRAFDQSEDAGLRGTDGAQAPFFSPDGAWVGFFAQGQLRKAPVGGGQVVTICDVTTVFDAELGPTATWAEDDTILFSGGASALLRVPAGGGTPTPLTTLDAASRELGHAWPVLLPGGTHALYAVVKGVAPDQFHVNLIALRNGSVQTIAPVGTAPSLVAGEQILFVKSGQLLAVRFDARRLATLGTPAVVVNEVGTVARPGTGSWRHTQPQYSLSRVGDLAYALPLPLPPGLVLRIDRAGRRTPVAELRSGFRGALSLSPDGQRLALYHGEPRGFSVWTLDVGRGILTRVISEGNPHAAVWSPDGERLVFSQDHAGTSNLFATAADGAGAPELLVTSAQHGDPGSWSRDGRWVAYAEANSTTDWDLWVLEVATRQARLFRGTPGAQQQPAISHDGEWLAYASNESGQFQVYVEAFPAGGKRVQISPDGGAEPLWSSDGRELVYRQGARLMSARVIANPSLSVTKPTPILDAPFLGAATYGPPAYAIAPDGRSFYFVQPTPPPPRPRHIHIVLGWLDEFLRTKATP